MWRRSLEDWLATTSLSGFNQFYIEQLYEQYTEDPTSVDEKWGDLFADLESGSLISQSRYYEAMAAKEVDAAALLVNTYRNYGHLLANLDPLKQWSRNKGNIPFNLVDFNLHPDQEVKLLEPVAGEKTYHAGKLYTKLKELYTGTLAYEFNHIPNAEVREWFINEIESSSDTFNPEEYPLLLQRLVRAELLEKALANKFPGAKRFSLEGNESYILLLDKLFEMSSDNNFRDIYLSMAHRGRLNALVNNFNLPPTELFEYFSGKGPLDDTLFNDDVKYHLGRSARFSKTSTIYNPQNKVLENPQVDFLDVHLCFNPSHLEFANAICLGASRAQQSKYNLEIEYNPDSKIAQRCRGENLVLPILVHGDSAVSGQGIVQEILNLSNTRAYSVGGSIHVVINNQIGFTTSKLQDMRSSTYCTDIAKMVEAPVIHVNSEDPLAVVKAAKMAFKYRQQFGKDIFIDLVGYRRLGHNEGDDPTVTQPNMYKAIRQKPLISDIFNQRLVDEGQVEDGYLSLIRKEIYQELIDGTKGAKIANLVAEKTLPNQEDFTVSEMTAQGRPYQNLDTSANPFELKNLALGLFEVPEDLEVSPTVAKLFEKRLENIQKDGNLNWGEAELLAYANLLTKGYSVRLTGEDSGRGTFFHRVGVLHNAQKVEEIVPMQDFAAAGEQRFELWDSTLSEAGVMGFEYGYSINAPQTLTLWEAQFGDFANGGQVIIDQFIASAETKWDQVSGLTLLLPHGFEGQGPEHSSARIERFLQLSANNNMRVVVPTNPRQMYHLLINQGLSTEKKPLIVFTPKSLLRSDLATTTIKELSETNFNPLEYTDGYPSDDNKIKKLIITNGRIRYDVEKVLKENNHFNGEVTTVSVEELYPWPDDEIQELLADLPHLEVIEWVQDEPENQGSWSYAFPHLLKILKDSKLIGEIHINYNGRPASATTAAGYGKLHQRQLAEILAKLPNRDTWRI